MAFSLCDKILAAWDRKASRTHSVEAPCVVRSTRFACGRSRDNLLLDASSNDDGGIVDGERYAQRAGDRWRCYVDCVSGHRDDGVELGDGLTQFEQQMVAYYTFLTYRTWLLTARSLSSWSRARTDLRQVIALCSRGVSKVWFTARAARDNLRYWGSNNPYYHFTCAAVSIPLDDSVMR